MRIMTLQVIVCEGRFGEGHMDRLRRTCEEAIDSIENRKRGSLEAFGPSLANNCLYDVGTSDGANRGIIKLEELL